IDAVPIDKVQGNLAEAGKVFWSREGEAAFIGLEAPLLTELHTLVPRVPITAPRRKPYAGRGPILRRCLFQRREATREAGMEVPQRRIVVPSVVKEKGIELDAAFLDEFHAIGLNHRQRRGFIELAGIADVVPG